MKKIKINDFTEPAELQCDVEHCPYKEVIPRCYLDTFRECEYYPIGKHFTGDDLQVNEGDS